MSAFAVAVAIVGSCDLDAPPLSPDEPAASALPPHSPPRPQRSSSPTADHVSWDGLVHLKCAPGTGRCGPKNYQSGTIFLPFAFPPLPRVFESPGLAQDENDWAGTVPVFFVGAHTPAQGNGRSALVKVDQWGGQIALNCSDSEKSSAMLYTDSSRNRKMMEDLAKSTRWIDDDPDVIRGDFVAGPISAFVAAAVPVGGRIGSDSRSKQVRLHGDCATATILGTYQEVSVDGWHASVEVDVRDANVWVELYPGSAAIQHSSIQSNRAVSLSVPARSGYRFDVPAGWQIACPEGLDPACGTMGPRRVGGAGKTDAYLAAPRGVLRIYDWVGGWDDAAPDVSIPLTGSWLGAERQLFLDREPPCRDVLNKRCGRTQFESLPDRDVHGRNLAPWFGAAP